MLNNIFTDNQLLEILFAMREHKLTTSQNYLLSLAKAHEIAERGDRVPLEETKAIYTEQLRDIETVLQELDSLLQYAPF